MKKVLFPIILVLSLACTIGIYYLLFDQHGHLFYINTVATCVAEVLLLMNVPIWSGKKMLNITSSTVSIFTNLYAIALFVWTLLFTLYAQDSFVVNFKAYYIGILIATLVFIILCGVSAIGAHTAEKAAEEQESLIGNRRNLVGFVKVLNLDITASLESADSEWKDEFERLVKMLNDKLSSFPSEKLNKNPQIAQKIENDMSDIATICEGLSASVEPEIVQQELTNKLNRLIKYVSTVKNL